MGTLQQAIQQGDERLFVGRADELALFAAWLDGDDQPRSHWY